MATRHLVQQRNGTNEVLTSMVVVVYAMTGTPVLSFSELTCPETSAVSSSLSGYTLEPGATLSVVYSSSNETVATVDSSGNVFGHIPGFVDITADLTASGVDMVTVVDYATTEIEITDLPGSYAAPNGGQVGFEFPDVVFYAPYGTDVGFQMFTEGPSFNAVINLGFVASLEAEQFLAVDMSVSVPLNFSMDALVIPFDQMAISVPLVFVPSAVVITFDQMAISVPMTFSAAVQATGTGPSGEVIVAPLYGVMNIRL